MQDRVYSRFATIGKTNEDVIVNLNSFLRKILLFDTFIIDSIRLKDIPQLVKNFSVDGLIELLNSGIVKIHCDALTTAQTGQAVVLESREKMGALPLCSYAFSNINMAYREKYISDNLKNVHFYVPNLKKAIKLKRAILDALIETPVSVTKDKHEGMEKAFKEKETLVKLSILNSIREKIENNKDIKVSDIDVKIIQISSSEFKVVSNLNRLLSVDELAVHKIIEKALLDISGLYMRLSYMKNFDATSWFHDNDLMLLKEEVSIASGEINSGTQEDRLLRILSLKGLPNVDDNATINVDKFLKMRLSSECESFRKWLKTIDKKDDKEIREEMSSISEKFSSFFHGQLGSTMRFVISTGVGLVVNPMVGIGINSLEEFVLNKIVKSPGPISFVNNSLPRLYQNN